MMVASTSVLSLMTQPRASTCRLTSANSPTERPSLCRLATTARSRRRLIAEPWIGESKA